MIHSILIYNVNLFYSVSDIVGYALLLMKMMQLQHGLNHVIAEVLQNGFTKVVFRDGSMRSKRVMLGMLWHVHNAIQNIL